MDDNMYRNDEIQQNGVFTGTGPEPEQFNEGNGQNQGYEYGSQNSYAGDSQNRGYEDGNRNGYAGNNQNQGYEYGNQSGYAGNNQNQGYEYGNQNGYAGNNQNQGYGYDQQSNYPYENQGYQYPSQGGYQQELEEPVKVGEWVVTLLLLLFVPCVNVVLLFVWAFSKKEKRSKSNFCKAYLIIMGIILAIYIVVAIIMAAVLMASGQVLN